MSLQPFMLLLAMLPAQTADAPVAYTNAATRTPLDDAETIKEFENLYALPEGEVLRRIAPPFSATRLEVILRQECKLPMRLSFRDVERKVIVARGKFQPVPPFLRREGDIELYGKELDEFVGAGGGAGNFGDFLKWTAMFIGQRIV